MTTDDTDPFEGRAYGDYVFRSRPDRNFFIGRLSPSQREKWLQEHPERWTSREDALRELEARGRTEPARTSLTTPATEVGTSRGSEPRLPAPSVDERLPDTPATSAAPQSIVNPQATEPATVAADDEIVIGERRFIGERRVAAMLGCSQRTLQRWRTEGKGPPSTKIGRKQLYELKELQEWIDKRKTTMMSTTGS
jgi:predicted DNA-binding transcriptional regulator AlpA